MSGILQRLVSDDFTIGQIRTMCRCRQCGVESIENSYQREQCHNGTYCSKCTQSCPICSTQKGPIPYLQQLLKSVKIKCVNNEIGCNAILPLDLLASHESSCQFSSQKWLNVPSKITKADSNDSTGVGKSQKVSFMSNVGSDSFPFIDFVSPDAIQYPSEQEDQSISNYVTRNH